MEKYGNLEFWLTPAQQVQKLKNQGVRFDIISESHAEHILLKEMNYFRLTSYCLGFEKVIGGLNDGRYANLDFAMLEDLSVIDTLLRYELLPMTLDIEQYSKLQLLTFLDQNRADGYKIVQDFLDTKNKARPDGSTINQVKRDIDRYRTNPYTGDLVLSCNDYLYPAWKFLELITFGTFNDFLLFCADKYGDKASKRNYYLLQAVRTLRNACAHNNCIINNLSASKPEHNPSRALLTALGNIGISAGKRNGRLKNDRLIHIATTLFMHQLEAPKEVHIYRASLLQQYKTRMLKNICYYSKNAHIESGLVFIADMIDGWFPLKDELPLS